MKISGLCIHAKDCSPICIAVTNTEAVREALLQPLTLSPVHLLLSFQSLKNHGNSFFFFLIKIIVAQLLFMCSCLSIHFKSFGDFENFIHVLNIFSLHSLLFPDSSSLSIYSTLFLFVSHKDQFVLLKHSWMSDLLECD